MTSTSSRANHTVRRNKRPLIVGVCHGDKLGFEVTLLKTCLTHLLSTKANKANAETLDSFSQVDVFGSDIQPDSFRESSPAMAAPLDFATDLGGYLRYKYGGPVDFVYSNAFAHAWNPVKVLKVWGKQLRKNGILVLH